jgi:hypothetical protein
VPQNTEIAIIQPIFKDIRYAAQRMGLTVYAMRVLVWNRLVRPVKKGQAYLFTEKMIEELGVKLASGELEFPRVPSRKKDIRKRPENAMLKHDQAERRNSS